MTGPSMHGRRPTCSCSPDIHLAHTRSRPQRPDRPSSSSAAMVSPDQALLPPSQRTYAQPVGSIFAYFVLQLFSFVSLSVLLVTFVSGRVKRDKTIWTLVAVFMASNWTSSLVLLSGTLMRNSGRETPFALCLVNSAFIMGGTSAMSVAAFNVVIKMFFLIMAAKGRLINISESRVLMMVLLASPWLSWLAFFVAGIVIGARAPDTVYKAVFYCAIDSDTFSNATMIVSAIIEVLTVIFTLTIGIILYLHSRSLRHLLVTSTDALGSSLTHTESATPSLARNGGLGGVSVNLVVRLGLFQICVIGALAVAIGTIDDFTSVLGDFAITSIGPLVFFIFSSQADILRAWHLLPSSSPSAFPPTNPTQSHTFVSRTTTPIYDLNRHPSSNQLNRSMSTSASRGRKGSAASTLSTNLKTPAGGEESFALDTLGYLRRPSPRRPSEDDGDGTGGLRPQSTFTDGGRSTPSISRTSEDGQSSPSGLPGVGESQVALRAPDSGGRGEGGRPDPRL